MNCWPTIPVAPRMPTSTLLREITVLLLFIRLINRSSRTKKNPPSRYALRRVADARFELALYAPSAHIPPTLRVPFVGTRFRVVGLVVAAANIGANYSRLQTSRCGLWAL